MGNPKAEIRSAPGGLVLTREELATALRVSLRTVDRMVAAEEIPVMDLGEDLVRFYLPDVLEALRSGMQKFGRKAAQPQGAGKSEVRNSKGRRETTNHTQHTNEITETRTTGEANQ